MHFLNSIMAIALALASAVSPARAAGNGDNSPPDAQGSPAGQGTTSMPAPAVSSPIRHIIFIVQENRTPDNLFHGLAGADIATQGKNTRGNTITLKQGHLNSSYDLGHSHSSFLDQYDNGTMDGSNKVEVKCNNPNDPTCPPSHPQYKYVNPNDVKPYFRMAQTYTFGDRMFQSNQGPSFPAHQFLIAGTSTPTFGGQYDADFVSENPIEPRSPTGCVYGPAGQHVAIINPQGKENRQGVFPCFEHPTVIDLLTQAGLTWSYYTANLGGILTAPNAIGHLSTGAAWSNVKHPPAQVLTDIANGALSDVSWVTPTAKASDHPAETDGTGPSWVASVVNAIGNSAYWADTAIFIVWDDWGGWFDHVPPPIYSSYESGFRVPLIVVSPYAKAGYVSHVVHTFGSLVKYIEVTFNLPSLGYEDARSDDMSDCFNYKQKPIKFQPIQAAHDAAFFIERARTEEPQDADAD